MFTEKQLPPAGRNRSMASLHGPISLIQTDLCLVTIPTKQTVFKFFGVLMCDT